MSARPTIGLMVPASNTTMEGEMAALLPEAEIRRLGVPNGTAPLTRETLPDYRAGALRLAEELRRGDLLVFGCTAAGFIAGPAGDAAFGEALAEAAGCPVVTTAGAMVATLRDDGAAEVAVVTPYLAVTNARLRDFLEAGGVRVARLASLEAPDIAALCAIREPEVEALALATMGNDVDALFIGCTQLPTRSILPGLAARFGRPAWSSISATAAAARRALA